MVNTVAGASCGNGSCLSMCIFMQSSASNGVLESHSCGWKAYAFNSSIPNTGKHDPADPRISILRPLRRGVATAAQSQAWSAILILYRHVLAFELP